MHRRTGVAAVLIFAGLARAEWDLSSLPHYQPQQQVSGTLRMAGAPFSGLVPIWEEAFKKYQPGVQFANELPSSDIAIAALIMGAADIAVCGREPSLEEVLGFTEKYSYGLTPIVVATGAWNTPGGSSWSPVVFVHKENPLTRLTMEQLDGIFGAERTGGYEENSSVFVTRHARGPEKNIRTWGELGLTGEWKNRPIQTYGYAHTGMRHFFELRVFHGGDKWNPNYREYVETGTKMVPAGTPIGSHDMLVELSRDKYGMAWSGNGHAARVPGLKAISLAAKEGGPYFEPTEQNMRAHDYPLSRVAFMYLNRKPGQALDPKIKEFLLFVLSSEGQAILARSSRHLPLTREMVLEQRRRLE